MNKISIIALFCAVATTGFVVCSSSDIGYRFAQENDIPKLLYIIEREAVKDSRNIVVLPRLFRKGALQSAIQANKLFVAYSETSGDIVGYKKLFVMNDAVDKQQTLEQEIRCLEGTFYTTTLAKKNRYNGLAQQMEDALDALEYSYNLDDTYIYNGADFTRKAYRGKGINSGLMNAALALLKPEVQQSIAQNNSKNVVMVYGVTEENEPRTPSIAREFSKFLGNRDLDFYAYDAVKPSFDPQAVDCEPLADEFSVKGYGCVLSCALNPAAKELS